MLRRRFGSNLGKQEIIEMSRIDELQWGELKPGTQIGKLEAVFPRVDKKEAMRGSKPWKTKYGIRAARRRSGSRSDARAAAAPASSALSSARRGPRRSRARKSASRILRRSRCAWRREIGREKSQGADKLLKVMVDIGDEVRQIVAGIAHGVSAGRVGRAQSRDRGESRAAKIAGRGIERNDRSRRRRRGRQARPVHVRRRCAGRRASKVTIRGSLS